MPDPVVFKGKVWEGASFDLAARVAGGDGTYLQQADVSDWDLRVYERRSNDPGTVIFELVNEVTSLIIFNALQTDGYWSIDSTGYNMRRHFTHGESGDTGTLILRGGRNYRVEFDLNTSSWGRVPVVWDLVCESLLGQ